MDIKRVDEWKSAIGISNLLVGVNNVDYDSLETTVEKLANGIRKIYNSALLKRIRKGKNTPWRNIKLESERM